MRSLSEEDKDQQEGVELTSRSVRSRLDGLNQGRWAFFLSQLHRLLHLAEGAYRQTVQPVALALAFPADRRNLQAPPAASSSVPPVPPVTVLLLFLPSFFATTGT